MKTAPIPRNEAERLIDLLSYELLDTECEAAYDDLVRIASAVCDTPIALVSLVDADRQWFKAQVGLDAKQTSRDISFCGHAIEGKDIFEIPDSQLDERFADNPLVTGEPKIKFYAGVPLINASGHALGTLCVIDKKSRILSGYQREMLLTLSRQVITHFELRKAHIENRDFGEELQRISKIVIDQNDKLRYFEKLRALHEMSNRVSHEVNNPLASMMLSHAGIKRVTEDEKILKKLATAEKSAKQIASIVESLKLFTQMETSQKALVSFDELVSDAKRLCEEKFKEVGVELSIDDSLKSSYMINKAQLLQVLVSVMENACDAIQGAEEKWIKVSARPEGIRVIDSGQGIPEAVLQKIMFPFFTTKEVGKGAGLGLSVCLGILQEHGGDFFYELFEGHTSFVLSIPSA
jgi:two-component system NtrC family sensor kinase